MTALPPPDITNAQEPHRGPRLSDVPTDQELFFARFFDEPLVPIGGPSGEAERRALCTALRAWAAARDPFTTEDLESFLAAHPESPWQAALWTNLGLVYRRTGRYGRAMAAWEAAWASARNATSANGRAIGDRAVSELAVLNARIGRMDRLEALFEELRGRSLRGSAHERLTQARQGLSMMYCHPEIAFLCGPMALANVRCTLRREGAVHPEIQATRSTVQGTSLDAICELAARAGTPMRRVHRMPGADLVAPAVIHWKLGHFAALTRATVGSDKRARYLLQDPTFYSDIHTTQEVLDEETSGYMLISADVPLPAGWREVDSEEARTVWGKGWTSGGDPGAYGDEDTGPRSAGGGGGGSCSEGGIAKYFFHELLAALRVEDKPVWIRVPFGPSLTFKVAYNQADSMQDSVPRMANLGPKWTFNWCQYLRTDGARSVDDPGPVQLFKGGGGFTTFTFYSSPTSSPEVRDRSTLEVIPTTSGAIAGYCRTLRDGTVEEYSQPDFAGTTFYLTAVIDPQGNPTDAIDDTNNRVRLNYTNETSDHYVVGGVEVFTPVHATRLSEITGALGQSLVISYRSDLIEDFRCDYFLIRSVTAVGRDGDSQSAHFEYDHSGRLIKITDMAEVVSTFGYSETTRGVDPATAATLDGSQLPVHVAVLDPDPDFMRWMRTPYGITRFQTGWLQDPENSSGYPGSYNNRWVEATAPNGDTQRIEFRWDEAGHHSFDAATEVIPAEEGPPGAPASVRDYFARTDPSSNPNANLNYRNSLYWDARAYRRAGGTQPAALPGPNASLPGDAMLPLSSTTPSTRRLDYRYAHITHWLHAPGGLLASGVPESEVTPGENRIWYVYQEQTSPEFFPLHGLPSALPIRVARNLAVPEHDHDSGFSYTYNGVGNITSVADPVGRVTRFDYHDNQIDVWRVWQGEDLVAQYERYVNHRAWETIDAAGGHTRLVYNRCGQPLSLTRPDGTVVRYVYDTVPELPMMLDDGTQETIGSLLRVSSPDGNASWLYNSRNLIRESTDRDGVHRVFHYDALDRVIRVDYDDRSYETFSFQLRDPNTTQGWVVDPTTGVFTLGADDDRNAALGFEWTKFTDRDRKWVLRVFDQERRLVLVRRPAPDGRNEDVRITYPSPMVDELTLTDGNLHVTRWRQAFGVPQRYDDRPTELRRPDATSDFYDYDSLGHLSSIRHPLSRRTTTYHYTPDGRIDTVTATGASARWYEFDPQYPRLRSAGSIDEMGVRRSDVVLAYVPSGMAGAGNIQVADHPPSGVAVHYDYDDRGRLRHRWTTPASLALAPSPLEFSYGGDHLSSIAVLAGVDGPSVWEWQFNYPTSTPIRPGSLNHPNGATTIFEYESNHDFRLNHFQTRDSRHVVLNGVSTDSRHVVLHDVSTGRSSAGRRVRDTQHWPGIASFPWQRDLSYNETSRLARVDHSLILRGRRFAQGSDQYVYDLNGNLTHETNTGLTDDGSIVELRGETFHYDEGDSLTVRSVTIPPISSSRHGHRVVSRSSTSVAGASADDEGRLDDDSQFQYGWDALGQIESVTRSGSTESSNFVHDFLGRVRFISDSNSKGGRHFIWDGLVLLEERSSSGEIIRAYRPDGFQQLGREYIYLRDASGSVVGLMDANAHVVKIWNYDAWGFRTVAWQAEGMEDVEPALGFAGYLQHEESGLCLMPARAYSPALRRWLSRDPIGIAGGMNLYEYSASDPINIYDPTGTNPPAVPVPMRTGAGGPAGGALLANPETLGLAFLLGVIVGLWRISQPGSQRSVSTGTWLEDLLNPAPTTDNEYTRWFIRDMRTCSGAACITCCAAACGYDVSTSSDPTLPCGENDRRTCFEYCVRWRCGGFPPGEESA